MHSKCLCIRSSPVSPEQFLHKMSEERRNCCGQSPTNPARDDSTYTPNSFLCKDKVSVSRINKNPKTGGRKKKKKKGKTEEKEEQKKKKRAGPTETDKKKRRSVGRKYLRSGEI